MLRIIAVAALVAAAPAAAGERLVGRAHVVDGEAAKAFMVELIEWQTVVCDLTGERTHGRRVGWCYHDGEDIAEALPIRLQPATARIPLYMWRHAPTLDGMIEYVLPVGVAFLVLVVFMTFAGWTGR